VKPFVKRQKNDGGTRPWPQWGRVSAWNDAEAITIAAQRPEMRFVAPKSEQQQARAVLFRGRERLIHQRTELVNALRAVMYEYGYTVPQGFSHIKRIKAVLDEPGADLPVLVVEECRDLLEQIGEKSTRINLRTEKVKQLALKTDKARRLQTMPTLVQIFKKRWRSKK
jgi:transposase